VLGEYTGRVRGCSSVAAQPIRYRHGTCQTDAADAGRARRHSAGRQFRLPENLYAKIVPIFEDFGFTPPSAGVIARDLSEKIEKAIIQHCESFTKGTGHCDLCRFDQDWEVKICKDSGLTINQSKVIAGESYIVVNYKANSLVKSIWVLWNAEDRFFSPRLTNSNARSINRDAAKANIEVIFPSN
jgi:hypothetical protein